MTSAESYPLFDSQTWPVDPAVPHAAPDGYLTPVQPPNPSTISPPLTAGQVDVKRQQFSDLILKQVVEAVTGFFLPSSSATNQLTSWASNIPLIGPLVGAITGIIGGGLDLVANLFLNVFSFLGFDLNEPAATFDPPAAALGLLGTSLNPSSDYGGLLSAGLVPGLDGSKIVSGELSPNVTGITQIATAMGLPGTPGVPSEGPQTIEDAATIAFYNSSILQQQQLAMASVQAWIAGESSRDASIGGMNRNIIIWNTATEGSPLSSSDFSSTGPSAGDLCVRGARPFIGIKASNGAGTYHAIIAYTFTKDDQAIELTPVLEGVYPGVATCGYIHANSGHAEGAYIRIFNNKIEIGKYTRTGGDYTYTPFTDGVWEGDIPAGSRTKFMNTGTTWEVVMNGAIRGTDPKILSVVDDTVTFDSSHRRAAISMQRAVAPSGFGVYPPGIYDSYRIAAINMRDNTTATAGSGAKMKTNSEDFADAEYLNTWAPLTNYFDVVEVATPDITADLVNSVFTVSKAGWYRVGIKYGIGTPYENPGAQFHPVLFKNADTYQLGSITTTGYDGYVAKWPNSVSGEFQVHLEEGDYVQAGYFLLGATNRFDFFKRDLTGLYNEFSIGMTSSINTVR